MQTSFYEEKQQLDKKREEADVIYRAFMDKNTQCVDNIIREIRDLTLAEFTQASNRLRKMLQRALQDKSRVAKHAAMLFGLYLTPDYANKLLQEAKVDPQRFSAYYQHHLPQMCQNHLNGKSKFDSMQAFVEEARTAYIII
mgnify:FL=1|tara:strand:- start:7537 stop:7959 length:423 start_codon:yes stop_codon:yes gene_type:complete